MDVFNINTFVTCSPVSRQRPKYAHATMEPVSQQMFSMWSAYVHCWVEGPRRRILDKRKRFSVGSVPRNCKRAQSEVYRVQRSTTQLRVRVQLWSVNQRPTEAEESPSVIFVTRKRLVKTLQMNNY
jgi:hypothetical protein